MQFVQISNQAFSMKPVLTGVPQGSIIGLLNNIFINDIVKPSKNVPLYCTQMTQW